MDSNQPPRLPPLPPPKPAAALKDLDKHNYVDRVVLIVEKYGEDINEAIAVAGLVKTVPLYNQVWTKVRRRQVQRERLESQNAADALIAISGTASSSTNKSTTQPNAPKKNKRPTITPGTSAKKHRGRGNDARTEKAADYVLDQLPGWVDKEKTASSLDKRKYTAPCEKRRETFYANAAKAHRDHKYSTAFKQATREIHKARTTASLRGRNGQGTDAIIKKYNTTILSSPGNRPLKKSTINRAIEAGRIGKSPLKNGRPKKVPDEVTRAIATQATMKQASGAGEASKQEMINFATGLTIGTDWHGKFNPEYAVRASRQRHPELLIPAGALNENDRRKEWSSYKTANGWLDGMKDVLLTMGMAKDVPGKIHGVDSEISLIHPDDAHRFVTTDETHHAFSNETEKGGSRARRWHNPSFTHSTEDVASGSMHTTGVYGATLAGEVVPPLYIFDTSAKLPENYAIDPAILEGLPTVIGKFGHERPRKYHSNIAVRDKGSMDTSLWEMYVRSTFVDLWPNISQEIKRDADGKMLSGPLFVKTDAGPGRLAKEAESLEFREAMWKMGVYIILSVPNGTSCTAEMDQGYAELKPACHKSTQRVVTMKLKARVEARKKARAEGKRIELEDELDELAEFFEEEGVVVKLEEGSADVDVEEVSDEGAVAVKYRGRVCTVTLNNYDLAAIVNGFPGDPIELRPFDYCMQKVKVIGWWVKVGFLPMTRNCLKDKKIRFELGEGGAPADVTRMMELLEEDYKKAGTVLGKMGFNSEVLDLELPVADVPDEITNDEEKLIQKIIDDRAINSAGKLFKLGIYMANSKIVLEAARRVKNMEGEKQKMKERTKRNAEYEVKADGCRAYITWKHAGCPVETNRDDNRPKFKGDGAKKILRALLPVIKESKGISHFNSGKKAVDRLLLIEEGWEKVMEEYARNVAAAEPDLWLDKNGEFADLGKSLFTSNVVDFKA